MVSKPFRIPDLVPKIEELTLKYPDSLAVETIVVPSRPSTPPYAI